MKEVKVISNKNLQSRLPLLSTLVTILALDYWKAPEWLWGCLGLLFLLMWITSIVRLVNEESVDVFEEKPTNKTSDPLSKKSKFFEKLDEAMERNRPNVN